MVLSGLELKQAWVAGPHRSRGFQEQCTWVRDEPPPPQVQQSLEHSPGACRCLGDAPPGAHVGRPEPDALEAQNSLSGGEHSGSF